jgi:integrase
MTPSLASNTAEPAVSQQWSWPPDRRRYDMSPVLSDRERDALLALGARTKVWRRQAGSEWFALGRLIEPLRDASATFGQSAARGEQRGIDGAVACVLHACVQQSRVYWGWDHATWTTVCGTTYQSFRASAPSWATDATRECVVALAYLLGDFRDPLCVRDVNRRRIAERTFGRNAMSLVDVQLTSAERALGYGPGARTWALAGAASEALLLQRSSDLSMLSLDIIDRLRSAHHLEPGRHAHLYRLHRVLAVLGFMSQPIWRVAPDMAAGDGVDMQWKEWVERWYETSTLTPRTRKQLRSHLFKVGRWLTQRHADARTPDDFTRQLCATYVGDVDRWRVGDYTERAAGGKRHGAALSPRAKVQMIYALRRFLQDCQEWEWIGRQFDAGRVLRTPRSLKALIGPEPRVIDDTMWAKLMWAGLNMETNDLRQRIGGTFYPVQLVRALTLTWLFAGLRSDEIVRLRVGCIRSQTDQSMEFGQDGDTKAVCLLDVPTNKTATAFTKPVDPLVGQAIAAWEAVRAQQPALSDRKTGVAVDMLFCHRGRKVSERFINESVIPSLCRKAGVPIEDARGRITSHRARATIASQLYNAKDPMTLFELQAWLGHRSPSSTQHYARITPTTLAKAYNDAGYFARNVRAIEVLVDRDAVNSGAAAAGTPWQHFDLGHGFCTYNFFEQCPHRMACARCEFYVPKNSRKAHLLEAKTNLQRMMVEIPLTDDEHAAVEGDGAAVDRLLERLADVPTPAGPTPRAMGTPPLLVNIPLLPVPDPSLSPGDAQRGTRDVRRSS